MNPPPLIWVLAALATWNIILGLKVLIGKRPVIIDSRWFLLLVSLGLLPTLITSMRFFAERPLLGISSLLMPLMLFWLYVYSLKGVSLFGIDTEDFQNKLLEHLQSLGLEFKQNLSAITFKDRRLKISLSIQEWLGSGQIRMKGKADKELFDQIISGLKKKDLGYSKIIPVFTILTGLLMLLLFGTLAFYR